ncbi:hypothetical protein HDV00_008480 [Rhizophlyctis rosea]|nr:hypothetical protein HDV00_008480 [Rhizophlyctis rosea]
MGEKNYLDFDSALRMVFPGRDVAPAGREALRERWNLTAEQRWVARGKAPVYADDLQSIVSLPLSEAVCHIVTVVKDWQAEEQQLALVTLEKRLQELRIFDADGPQT